MNRPRPVAAGLLLVAVLLTAGCDGDAKSSDSGEPSIGTPAQLLDSNQVAFPLQAYEASPQQVAVLEQAQDVLIGQCMKRFGFDFRPMPASPPDEVGRNAFRYGVSDPALVEKYGYGRPHGTTRPDAGRPSMGPNEQLVLSGGDSLTPQDLPNNQEGAEKRGGGTEVNGRRVPIGGCGTESALKLYSPTAATVDIQFAQNLEQQANSDSRRDSRVVKVVADWSACMAGRGYRTGNPLTAIKDIGLGGDRISSPEAVTAARADLDCKRSTNLVGIWSAVETAYQKRLAEKNAQTLELARTQQDERMRLADSLLHP
ncbi:hypothetical protein [Kitasatospora sp. NPDC057198]|uniref:hypothetical protein n=1 Tax=Kitasatospora sp. NPDC057198 TaxID=3346046 RepID=UPI00363D0019